MNNVGSDAKNLEHIVRMDSDSKIVDKNAESTVVKIKRDDGFNADLKPKQARTTMYDLDNGFGYLVSGYSKAFVDEKYKENLANDILNLIWLYLPKLVKFELFNESCFKLNKNDTIIIGTKKQTNNNFLVETNKIKGYMVYPESLSKSGMDRGIYYLTIRNIKGAVSIGIKSIREPESVIDAKWNFDKDEGLYYYLMIKDIDCVVTIRLDCDNWTVAYFQDKYKWQWYSATVGWKDYHETVSDKIDEAYEDQVQKYAFKIRSNDTRYEIDFGTMKQCNMDTNRVRDVRRAMGSKMLKQQKIEAAAYYFGLHVIVGDEQEIEILDPMDMNLGIVDNLMFG